jgi:glycosyltransferase 2 family protein
MPTPSHPGRTQPKAAITRWLGSRPVHLGLGILISVISFTLALRSAPLEEVQVALGQARLSHVGWALLLVVINNLAKVVRWRVLLAGEAHKVSLVRLGASHLAGQALNLLYPGRVGEISRVYVVGQQGVSRVFVLGTVALEKLFDLLVYSLLVVLALLLIPLPDWINQSTYILVGITLLSFLLVWAAAFRLERITRLVELLTRRLPQRMKAWILARLGSALTSLQVLHNQQAFIQLAFWTAVVWGTAILTNHAALLAMGLTLPLTASLLLLIVLQAGVTIPSVPARLGLFEYLCVLALAGFGVEPAAALGFGFLLHAVVMLPALLPGLVGVAYLGLSVKKDELQDETEPVYSKEAACHPGPNP